MTLINLHVYESEIKPRPIYICDCTAGLVSSQHEKGDIILEWRRSYALKKKKKIKNGFSDWRGAYIQSDVCTLTQHSLFISGRNLHCCR